MVAYALASPAGRRWTGALFRRGVEHNGAVRVLVSPGSFPDGVTAAVAAHAMASGWRARAADDVTSLPMSDGSTDLVDAVAASLDGELVSVTVLDPLGRAVPGTVLHVPGSAVTRGGPGAGTAVVEACQAVGGQLIDPSERGRAATSGTSEGVGHLLRAALETGAGRIVIGVGPAAVHDGGAGLLRGLGLHADALARGGAGLSEVGPADLAGLAELRAQLAGRDLVVACSTDEPLVGLHGAGAALVTRAGLEPGRAQDVDRAIGHFADVLETMTPRRALLPLLRGPDGPTENGAGRARAASRAYTGAGGGIGLVIEALGGRLLDGAGAVADLLGLGALVRQADLVVTACASLDADAVHSGVVATVGAAALRHAVPVVAVAGDVEASRRELARIGVVGSYALWPRPSPFAAHAAEDSGAAALVSRLSAMSARMAGTWSAA